MQQIDMFELMYPTFKFDRKIKLFEAFAGIGTQAMALKKLEIDFETVGISEIDRFAIQSYNAIHGETKNYGSITDIKGGELPQVDLFTYSFPCQDISLAGQQQGFSREGNTRSGLLWEVERILKEMKIKPKVLLMENVRNLVSERFLDDFLEWKRELEKMGYSSYWEVLNAKDYEIPQNRERVFMVSILGDKKGYAIAKEGDGVYINRPHQKRGVVQKSMIQTLKTSGSDVGVVVGKLYHNTSPSFTRKPLDELARTIKCDDSSGVINYNTLKIRKLTPLECWRLMGISDKDFWKAKESGVSDTQLYKQAGNAIVVNVLEAIFKELIV